jgi:wyosine [tRNA(Phe)-imidazoG37] synthetase (radical SAM superfamily)
MLVERRAFYEPAQILAHVKRKVNELASRGENIDYITFAPSGEPTLDANLGKEISFLKDLGIPIAVITNASLLWCEDVRNDLLEADFVSLKVDTTSPSTWRRVNRPHEGLKLDVVLEGVKQFAKSFKGTLVSESMLIDGVDYEEELRRMASFLKGLAGLDKAYIAVPTRPPAERWVRPAKEEVLNEAFQIFSETLGSDKVELLIEYEGNAFTFTGNVKEGLLSITAVHPMREEAVAELLKMAGTDWQVVDELLRDGKLVRIIYEGKAYYLRKSSKRSSSAFKF